LLIEVILDFCGDTHIVALHSPSGFSTRHIYTLSLSHLSFCLSVTAVSAQSAKPSTDSHHGTSTRLFILLAAPTKCPLTNGRAGRTARSLYKRGARFQPEIIQRLHQKEGTKLRTSQLQQQEGFLSLNWGRIQNCVHLSAH